MSLETDQLALATTADERADNAERRAERARQHAAIATAHAEEDGAAGNAESQALHAREAELHERAAEHHAEAARLQRLHAAHLRESRGYALGVSRLSVRERGLRRAQPVARTAGARPPRRPVRRPAFLAPGRPGRANQMP